MTPGERIIAQLDGIKIGFPAPDGTTEIIIESLSLTIRAGERIGLVGASGSGKSLTALSVLGLVPPPGAILAGSVKINDSEIFPNSNPKIRDFRGGTVGIVFQEAESALNPVLTIGAHLREAIERHRPSEVSEWRKIATDLLAQVDLDPSRILKSHPHRLSGGQRQRALLAIALAGEPDLIIADEPTSSLDVLTQARLLGLIDRLCSDRHLALLLISHDLGVVSSLVNRVAVVLAGAIIEEASTEDFLDSPLHPYSQSLVASARRGDPKISHEGNIVRPKNGCAFVRQCPLRSQQCEHHFPDLVPVKFDRAVRCPVVAEQVT